MDNKFMKIQSNSDMERYMIHLKNDGYSPKDSSFLVHQARKICFTIPASVRVARVARKFLEFDVSVNPDDLDLVIEKLNPIGSLDNVRHVFEEKIGKEDGIHDGVFYFNNERFWESHESLEGVWKQCYGREKELVQGIILLAVAFAHAQKNELRIGIGMLKRALEKLGDSPEIYGNIDVDRIRNKIKEMQKTEKLTIFEI
jgi:predicted metal-dependent hydrolase